MRASSFICALFLAGCGQNPLPVCDCPALPDLGPAEAARDLSVDSDLAAPPDLTTVIDLSNADAPSLPEIFEILPNQPMRVGDTVKILGRKLGCSSYCYVQLGSSYATLASGADDNMLSFVVPSLSLPANGAYLELTVLNTAGSAHQSVTVLPAPVPPTGTLSLLWRDVDRASLDVGQTTSFHFTVRSNANQPLPVNVSAFTTDGVLFPSVLDPANNQLLAAGASRDFVVQLTPASGNAALSLSVRASAGGINGFMSITGLQVGAPIPAQDFALDLHAQPSAIRSSVDDLLAINQKSASLFITGELRSAGTWGLDAEVSSADWGVRWGTPAPVQLTAAAADVASGPALRSQQLIVGPTVPSPAPAFLTVTAQEAGSASARTLRYRLVSPE